MKKRNMIILILVITIESYGFFPYDLWNNLSISSANTKFIFPDLRESLKELLNN